MRNNEELSKIHIYLRKSRLFYIPRKCYAIMLGIRRAWIQGTDEMGAWEDLR